MSIDINIQNQSEVVDMMTPELEKLVDLLAHIAVDITLKQTNEESCQIPPLQ